MWSIDLQNAGMAIGAAALAVPVLIHLLTRHTPRTVPFPTLRFLRRSIARQSRLLRLRHLLLLMLRMLVIALLAAAFMRPVLRLPFQKLAVAKGQTTTLIILDTSLSMGYTGSGTTPLTRAKAEAIRLLQALRDGDRANVFFASASVQPAAPQLTRDLNTLRDEVERAQASLEKADLNAAIQRAVEEFGRPEAGSVRKELYLLSDYQRTNWGEVRLDSLPPDVALYLVDVDSTEKANAAVTQIRTRPAAPRAGDVVEVACEIANYGPEARDLPAQLEVAGPGGGAAVAKLQQHVLAPAYGSATALFHLRLKDVGDYEATARIAPDHLKADDVRYAVLHVRKSLAVALLTSEDADSDRTSAFYLVRALSPKPGAEASIAVSLLDAAQALKRDFRGTDVIFLSNLGQLSPALAQKLVAFLQGGGGVLYFAGGGPAPEQLRLLNQASPAAAVAPFTVSDMLDVRGMGRGYVAWTEARYESPMLRLFREPEHGDLSGLKFTRFRLVTGTDSRAEVLLKYEDGTPAAARSRVGSGSFVLCNFSPQPECSDLVKHEVFPPLLHELVKGTLSDEAAAQEFQVGHAASLALEDVPGTPALTFTNPRGDRVDARAQRIGQSLSLLVQDTAEPGFYRVKAAGGTADAGRAAALAVNVPADESDLRALQGAELAEKQQMAQRSHAVQADLDPGYVERLRRGRELWAWLLIAAIVVGVVEHAAATWLRPR